jgi:hypothetical protein
LRIIILPHTNSTHREIIQDVFNDRNTIEQSNQNDNEKPLIFQLLYFTLHFNFKEINTTPYIIMGKRESKQTKAQGREGEAGFKGSLQGKNPDGTRTLIAWWSVV